MKSKHLFRFTIIIFSVFISISSVLVLLSLFAVPVYAVEGVNEAGLAITKTVSDEPLIGGEIGYTIQVENTADTGEPLEDDKAYNITITDTLPSGITYQSSSLAPTQIINNPDGSTSLVWNNFTDLEQREITSILIFASIDASIPLGNQITNTALVEANTLPDNSGNWLNDETSVVATVQAIDIEKEILPSTAVNQTTGASGWESTAPGTGAGAEWPYQYQLTVRNNDVDDTANVVVTDTLPAGVAYLGPTTIAPNPNSVPVAPTMTVLPDGSLQLVWNLGTLTTNEYDNPPVITFGVAIPYRERVDVAGGANCTGGNIRIPNSTTPTDPGCFDGAIIADHSTWDNAYEASGVYSATVTTDGTVSTPGDDPEIPVTAVYQTIEKSVSPGTVQYGDILTFTLNYYVSEYYTLTNDVITDVLPDGLSYVPGSASIAPTSVTTDTPAVGETSIVWNIADANTTPGSQGQITFRASVDTDYENITGEPPIVALDTLVNNVTMTGDWTDDVDPVRTGSTTESANAMVDTLGPHIEKYVQDPNGDFVKGPVTATIGDELVFLVHYHAPSGMSADDNYLADFLPRGMSLVSQLTCNATGAISNTYTSATSGDTDNDPCTYYTYTVGGLEVVRWNYGYVFQNFAMTSTIQARIDDIPDVADGVLVENFLKASGTNTPGDTYSLRDTADIEYVEPNVVLTKSVSPMTNLVVGDTVTYTIDFQPTGVVTAYNLIVTDTIPVGIMIDLTSCVPPNCSVLSGSPEIGAGGVISWTVISDLSPGETQTFTYTGEITTSVTTMIPVVNIATVSYNTQSDGSGRQTPGTSDTNDPNTDDAAIIVGTPGLEKSIVATSEEHTILNAADSDVDYPDGREQVAIGEIVRYRLVMTVPEGTAPDLVLRDILDAGLQFLNDNTATVAFVSNEEGITITSGIPSGCEATLNISGNSPVGVIPQCSIPTGGITDEWGSDTFLSGTDPFFYFFQDGSDFVNMDTDADAEFIIIEFNALVNNQIPFFANDADDLRINSYQIIVDGVNTGDESNQVQVRIVEPDLEIQKTASADEVEVGDIVTFTLVITNNSIGMGPLGRDTADAFDLNIADTLPGELNLQSVSYTTPVSGTVTDNTAAPNVALSVSRLNVGETMVVTITAQVDALLGDVITNVANIHWTSLPITGTLSNPTGSSIPGDSGDLDGERNGTSSPSDVNDYNDTSLDTIVALITGAIGDYVWLDENSDGVQDAGEPGIPNVIMELYTITGTLVTTTTTDANGGYLFPNVLTKITYRVTVRTSSLPPGLAANPTYDEDGIITPHTTGGITLSAYDEHMTADFGYNWNPTSDVDNPSSGDTGAIGDRVWIDADGDGVQDIGEAGLGGVTVRLYTDPNGDGVYDNLASSTSTDPDGSYIFDGLTPGAYVVFVDDGTLPAGYTQTGDPDYFGETLPAGEGDNQTTTPVVLAPGDVYVNADFGYQPSTSYTIGDTIYFDAAGDGVLNGSDYGIAGVTVSLLDSNGNIIATDITDSNGNYSFSGLPDGTSYTVWVNDTRHVLGRLYISGDPDGGDDGRSAVTLSGADNLDQDFGYVPLFHDFGDGLIGDTVFRDDNNDGSPDPGEGLEGIVVTLTFSNGDTKTTTTNENGYYSFGNLPSGTYTVTVTAPSGMTNTFDPDGGFDSRSVVTIGTGGVDLDQDFGYQGAGTIGDLVFNDLDADGVYEPGNGESGIDGVTVELYLDVNGDGRINLGDVLVGTTTTSGGGAYSFNYLSLDDGGGDSDADYIVHVTDEANVLNGYWHSRGSDDTDDNSQADPYDVVLNAGTPTVDTADFGYYVEPGALGNLVWLDLDSGGDQDAVEPGIQRVPVTLRITYPNSDVITVTVQSREGGFYSFGNLLLDEDYNGDGVGEPTYQISIMTPPGMNTTNVDATGNDFADSDDHSGVPAYPLQGQTDVSTQSPVTSETVYASFDFGFTAPVDLGDLPEPNYPTYFQPGPSHIIFPIPNNVPTTTNGIPAVWLGLIVDTETDGQPNMPATGDDDNGDDEDGLTFAQNGYIPGATNPVTITINASEPTVTVYYGLWIDWDQNGSFEDFYGGSGTSGSPADVAVGITVPSGYIAEQPVYFRLRVLDVPLSADDYDGTFVNGEVEDYGRAFTAAPTAIRLKDFSTQNKPLVFGWVAMAIALMAFPVVLILRRQKR